jgi:hypothetical protein
VQVCTQCKLGIPLEIRCYIAQAGFHANIITRKNGIGKRFAPAKEFIDAYIFHNPWQTMKKQAKE